MCKCLFKIGGGRINATVSTINRRSCLFMMILERRNINWTLATQCVQFALGCTIYFQSNYIRECESMNHRRVKPKTRTAELKNNNEYKQHRIVLINEIQSSTSAWIYGIFAYAGHSVISCVWRVTLDLMMLITPTQINHTSVWFYSGCMWSTEQICSRAHAKCN